MKLRFELRCINWNWTTVYNITDRIDSSKFKGFSEKAEDRRFVFVATDISLNGVNNSDSFFDAFVFNKLFKGFEIRIYLDGSEQYRGDITFQDIKFNDTPPKTIDMKSYGVLRRTDSIKYRVFAHDAPEDALTLGALKTSLNDHLQRLNNDIKPPLENSLIMDLRHSLQDVYMFVKLGNSEGDRTLYDVWQEPMTKEIFGIEYSRAERHFYLLKMRDNNKIQIKDWKLTGRATLVNSDGGTEIIDLEDNFRQGSPSNEKIKFFRARINSKRYISLCVDLDLNGHPKHYWYTIDRNFLSELYTGSRENGEAQQHYVVYGEGINPPVFLGNDVVCTSAGFYNYHIVNSGVNQYRIDRYNNRRFVNTIRTVETTSPLFITEVHTGKITYFYDTQQTSRFKTFTITAPLIETEGALVVPLSVAANMNGEYYEYLHSPIGDPIYGTEFIGSYINSLYPTGSDVSAYNGQFCYLQYKGNWYCTDPIFLVLSSLVYQSAVSLRDRLEDVAQCFNLTIYTRGGQIYLIQRDGYIETKAIHKSWIAKNGITRELRDDSNIKIDLKFASNGLSNLTSQIESSKDEEARAAYMLSLLPLYDYGNISEAEEQILYAISIISALQYYYTKRARNKLVKYSFEMAMEAFLSQIGAQITVNPDGIVGIMIKRDLSLEKSGNMIKLIIERILDL